PPPTLVLRLVCRPLPASRPVYGLPPAPPHRRPQPDWPPAPPHRRPQPAAPLPCPARPPRRGPPRLQSQRLQLGCQTGHVRFALRQPLVAPLDPARFIPELD